MTVLKITSDLIFSTKISEVASALGVECQSVRSLEKLTELLNSNSVTLALIDLNAARSDPFRLIRELREKTPHIPIISFFSHVDVELADQARALGVEVVLPRSAFVQKLPDLLASHTAPKAESH